MAEKEAERMRKEQEKEAEKAKKSLEKEAERMRKMAEREMERTRKEQEKEIEKVRKVAEKEKERERKAAKREHEKRTRIVKAKPSAPSNLPANENDHHSSNPLPASAELSPRCDSSCTVDLARPQPRPRPAFRGVLAEKSVQNGASTELDAAIVDAAIDPELLKGENELNGSSSVRETG